GAGGESITSEALNEARAAVIDRAGQPEAIANLPAMKRAAVCLLEVLKLSQQLGTPQDEHELTTAIQGLLLSFAAVESQRLGVEPGVDVPPDNSPIAEMNRFTALQTLRDILTVVE